MIIMCGKMALSTAGQHVGELCSGHRAESYQVGRFSSTLKLACMLLAGIDDHRLYLASKRRSAPAADALALAALAACAAAVWRLQ